jgi:hypothetical protein
MGNTPIRSPLVEELLRQGQFLMPGEGRPLTGAERAFVRQVFGQSLNLPPIRIVFSNLHVNQRAYTLGNAIRAPRSIPLDDRTLIHELAHVWQFQTRGTSYISDSIYHQAVEGAAAYNVTIVPGQSILRYGAEQQASIIERYYANDPPGFRDNPDVLRMMEEVRSMRPITEAERQQELIYGPAGPPRGVDFGSGRREDQPAPIVPLIRFQW